MMEALKSDKTKGAQMNYKGKEESELNDEPIWKFGVRERESRIIHKTYADRLAISSSGKPNYLMKKGPCVRI